MNERKELLKILTLGILVCVNLSAFVQALAASAW